MNTLLYRAWHKELRKMYRVAGWVDDFDGWITVYCRDEEGIVHPFPRSEVILMQSPGWTDKHGKTIYRNDIVRLFDWEEALCQVMWVDDGFWIVQVHSEDSSPEHLPHDHRGHAKSAEVVGNIFTHPQWYTYWTGIDEIDRPERNRP